jgi:phage/plasmid-associated DNA primase
MAETNFQDMLAALIPDIPWKISLNGCKTIYRQMNQTYFEEITPDQCKMEVREYYELATPSTIASLVTALCEDRNRLLDDGLFREARRKGIGFLNGVFDLDTGKMRKYQPTDFVLQPLPWMPPTEMDAKAETYFLTILKKWVGDDVGDWFCSVLAYMLFLYPNTENVWLNLFGAGSNGKSVCLELLEKMLGDEKVIGCDLKNINRFSGDTFKNKWLVIGRDSSAEVSDNAVSFIKTYTGDPKLLVEKKGGASFDVYNPGKLIVSTNSLIRSKDRSYAWYRRLFPIPFPNEFARNERFKSGLFEQIPAILRVLLDRAYRYAHNETTLWRSVPNAVHDLMKETRMLNDRVAAFWEEYFFETEEPSRSVTPKRRLKRENLYEMHQAAMSQVYQTYVDWHEREFGETALEPSLKTFGGPYGAFLSTGAGKFYTYKRTKHGRVLVLDDQYLSGGWDDEDEYAQRGNQ